MAKLTSNELRKLMVKRHNIRNVAMIGDEIDGRAALTDVLVQTAGIFAKNDPNADEAAYGYDIQYGGIPLYCKISDFSLRRYRDDKQDGEEFLINLVDSFEGVDGALPIYDGALVVVDCFKEVSDQTKAAITRAIEEKVYPVLVVNNVDLCFSDPHIKMDEERAYEMLNNVIQGANSAMPASAVKARFKPVNSNVTFASPSEGWAFTLENIAEMYEKKYGIPAAKLLRVLWGNYFLDLDTKRWSKKHNGSPRCVRGFAHYVFRPMRFIICLANLNRKNLLFQVLKMYGIKHSPEDGELFNRKDLMQRVMQTWLPARTALLEMVIRWLPSPASAQQYRVKKMYVGPVDDAYFTAIMNCDPEGPLMMYVSKMIPMSKEVGFFAFGRVFSGKVKTGSRVRIISPNNLYLESIKKSVLYIGNKLESFEEVQCGNIVALVGLDGAAAETATATLTGEGEDNAYPINAM